MSGFCCYNNILSDWVIYKEKRYIYVMDLEAERSNSIVLTSGEGLLLPYNMAEEAIPGHN